MQLLKVKSMILYIPPNGTAGLVLSLVKGKSRSPLPPAMMKVKTLRIIRIDPDQHRIGLSLRKVDSAAFADKDFKMLTRELENEPASEPIPSESQTQTPEGPRAEDLPASPDESGSEEEK